VPNSTEIRIRLGMTATRLGDAGSAAAHLRRAAADLEASGERDLLPLLYTAFGGLAYESGDFAEARSQFARSAQLWVDESPDAAAVEATAYVGLLDGLKGSRRESETALAQSIEHARAMHRVVLEARARVFLARLHCSDRRFDTAVQVLAAIPDDAEQGIGRELQAQAQYWRSVAFAGLGNVEAAQSQAGDARRLVSAIQALLPEPDRARYAARPDIRRILG
jgi:hypothetical protein